jgi:hypothetical protein
MFMAEINPTIPKNPVKRFVNFMALDFGDGPHRVDGLHGDGEI